MGGIRNFGAAALALCLAGCASAQRFSANVTAYNIDAERAENQQILLNVVRASQRQPMEFTQLQSVSGVSSAGLTVNLTQPLKQYGGTTASTLAPSITTSGGPTITVGVLDTQEFYQGILKPLTIQELDYYLKRGLPKRAVYTLFVSKIEIRLKGPDGKPMMGADAKPLAPFEYLNSVDDAQKFNAFQRVLDALLADGLNTKPTKGADIEGPVLTPDEAAKSDFMARSAAAGLQVSALDWCDLDDAQRHDVLLRLFPPPDPSGDGARIGKDIDDQCKQIKANPDQKFDITKLQGAPATLYQATKPSSGYALCLTNGVGDSKCDESEQAPSPGRSLKATALGAGSKACALVLKADPAACAKSEVSFALTTRSTGGVIYYLGEVMRMANYPDSYATCVEGLSDQGCSRVIAVRVHPPDEATPAACETTLAEPNRFSNPNCEPLFFVSNGGGANGGRVQVRYGSKIYGIPPGKPGDFALTYDVLDIVSELVDLHRSAKDLPASNVLTVVGSH
jgi:hypothetical protein